MKKDKVAVWVRNEDALWEIRAKLAESGFDIGSIGEVSIKQDGREGALHPRRTEAKALQNRILRTL
jgi:hypothetical protein